jgi:tetraacyldisaccharide 4'-kinase
MNIRLGLEKKLSHAWRRRGPLAVALLPATVLFASVAALRRCLYRLGLFEAVALPVPVVVVGNVTAGGSGKTPLVLYLARQLAACGRKPGIVSRGYGGRARAPREVSANCSPALVGDEPLLLARRAGCPVWIGRDRYAAARALLAAHPECDLVLSDDGLQHYRLARTVEIAVIGRCGLGNGWLLPSGPLREPAGRLAQVDAIVLNGEPPAAPGAAPPARFRMSLGGNRFLSLDGSASACGPEAFRGRPVHAVAGIGDPQRFFQQLRALGLQPIEHPFPDHHPFAPEDLRFGDDLPILMTEKDGVKCAPFAPGGAWMLPVEAQLQPDLARWLLEKLDGRAPA